MRAFGRGSVGSRQIGWKTGCRVGYCHSCPVVCRAWVATSGVSVCMLVLFVMSFVVVLCTYLLFILIIYFTLYIIIYNFSYALSLLAPGQVAGSEKDALRRMSPPV